MKMTLLISAIAIDKAFVACKHDQDSYLKSHRQKTKICHLPVEKPH